MTPLFKGPLRAPLRHLGAVCCDPRAPTSDACGGPFALNQQRARQRQGGPSGPWPVHVNPNTRPRPWPLGALATTGRAFVVLLCCRVVVLWTRAQSPQPAHQPGPCTPQRRPRAWPCCPGRACAPDHRCRSLGQGIDTRPGQHRETHCLYCIRRQRLACPINR